MTERCENCRFAIIAPINYTIPFGGDIRLEYKCRRRPESLIKEVHDWCGEWQAKGEE